MCHDRGVPGRSDRSGLLGSWGAALGIYLTHRQHLPVLRAAELMSHSLGAPVSTGFLSGLAGEAARRLTPFMARTKELLARNPVVNTDETSIRVSAKSWWLHVIATPMLTLLVCHRSRGRDAIEGMDVLPGYGGVIVHDGLSTYDNLDDAVHAQCGAHYGAPAIMRRRAASPFGVGQFGLMFVRIIAAA